MPYGWQFKDEQVAMPSAGRGGVNCFALLSRDNRAYWHLTDGGIDAAWVSERLDALSLSLARPTVVVLDNASIHTKAAQERAAVWQALSAVGRSLHIRFSAFRVEQSSLT